MFVPPPSEVVLPNRSKDYTIRFEPNRSGTFFDSITFILPCKNAIHKVYLVAYKEKMNVMAEPNSIDFAPLIACKNDSNLIQITVTNNENFDIELNQPKTENPFSIVTTGFPKALRSDSSSIIEIKFKSSIPGDYSKNLIIPFSANGVNDEIHVKLNGKVLSTSYRLEYYGQPLAEIEFQLLTGCDDSAYSAFQIFNTGEIDLEFSVLQDIAGIYMNDLPVLLKPNRSIEVPILFVPQEEGIFNETLFLVNEPCGFVDSVKLTGSKYGITYGMSKQIINFGQIINCNNSGVLSDSVKLIVSGQSQGTPYIAKITGPTNNYFSHNIVQGMSLSDTNIFRINLDAVNPGEYIDTIRILIKPCDIEKTISLYANRINPEIGFSNDTLDFGFVPIETSDTNSIVIRNTGEVDVILDDIQFLSAPFELLSSFPLTLKPDSLVEILFEYTPLQIKEHLLKLNVIMSEPCDFTYDLWLKGNGDLPKYISTEISVPLISIAELSKDVIIPVAIKSLGNRNIKQAKVSDIRISLRYNPTMLYPKSVSLGSALAASSNHVLKYEEGPPGLFNIHTIVDTLTRINDGNLFEVKFLALLGNSMNSQILFEKLEIQSDIDLTIDTVNGTLRLIGGCSLEERLLSLEGNFALYLISNNPIMDICELIAEIPLEEYTELEIYDINGNLMLQLMKGIYPPGKYKIEFSMEKYSAGIYIVNLKQGLLSSSIQLVFIK